MPARLPRSRRLVRSKWCVSAEWGCERGGRYLCAGLNLPREEFNHDICDLLQQRLGLLGPGKDPALDLCEHLAATPLDHVSHEGPGGADEAEQRDPSVELPSGLLNRLKDVAQLLRHIHLLPELLAITRVPQRLGKYRPPLLNHLYRHPQRLRHDENVAEDDRRVDEWLEPLDRLQRDRARDLGRPTDLEEVACALGGIVLYCVPVTLDGNAEEEEE